MKQTKKTALLVFDALSQTVAPLRKILSDRNFDIERVENCTDATKSLDKSPRDLLIVDIPKPDAQLESFILNLNSSEDFTPMILCTPNGRSKQDFNIWASGGEVVCSNDIEDIKRAIKNFSLYSTNENLGS